MAGIPIVLIIVEIGVAISNKAGTITTSILNCNGAVIPFSVAFLYTVSLLLLDGVHYGLLIKAVRHGKEIEHEHFKNLLNITHKLTSDALTFWHTLSLILMYFTILALSLALIWLFWNGEIFTAVNSSEIGTNAIVGLLTLMHF